MLHRLQGGEGADHQSVLIGGESPVLDELGGHIGSVTPRQPEWCHPRLWLRHIHPVALALERVGRQGHFAPHISPMQPCPVNDRPAHVHRPETGEQGVPCGLVWAQTREIADSR